MNIVSIDLASKTAGLNRQSKTMCNEQQLDNEILPKQLNGREVKYSFIITLKGTHKETSKLSPIHNTFEWILFMTQAKK